MLLGGLLSAQPRDGLCGYTLSTSVERGLWRSTTERYTLPAYGVKHFEAPFPICFFGRYYSSFSVSADGTLALGAVTALVGRFPNLAVPAVSAYRNFQQGKPCPFELGYGTGADGSPSVVCRFFGSADATGGDTAYTRTWEVEFTQNGLVTLIYGECSDRLEPPVCIGLQAGDGRALYIDPQQHEALAGQSSDAFQSTAWPGQYRCYQFQPLCLSPRGLCAQWLSATSARFSWRNPGYGGTVSYYVEYGPVGFAAGEGVSAMVEDTFLVAECLDARRSWEFHVSPLGPFCRASSYVLPDIGGRNRSKIAYDNLYAEGVECYYGDRRDSTAYEDVVDFGPADSASRHTVVRDTSAWHYFYLVPDGYDCSVRLGDLNSQAQYDSIVYTLQVDTSDYDLLLLKFAMMEQDAGHASESQPYFSFAVYDEAGSLLSVCSHANFVAGDNTGWQDGDTANWEYWHDWQTVGFDLTPYHGQRIKVALANYDCTHSGHYGYAYFVLDGMKKRISASHCAEFSGTLLRAPEGFTYQWYKRDGSGQIISTSDTLRLVSSEPGYYACQLGSLIYGQDGCSVMVTSYVGPRYPVAAFDIEPQTPCGSQCLLHNRSYVVADTGRTQLLSETCDSYMWVIDGCDTLYAESPIYYFRDEGLHHITLLAYLGTGCIDSISDTLRVLFNHDTVEDNFCYGQDAYMLPFWNGRLVPCAEDDSGYAFVEGCTMTHLRFTAGRDTSVVIEDTILLPAPLQIGPRTYLRPGRYCDTVVTATGCDSVTTILLSSLSFFDTTVCVNTLPLWWHGRYFTQETHDTIHHPIRTLLGGTVADSIVVTHLRVEGEYELRSDTLCEGDTLSWHGRTLRTAGTYQIHIPVEGGCDTLFSITLTVRPLPYVTLDLGQTCADTPYYFLALPDTLIYLWAASPASAPIPYRDTLGHTCIRNPMEAAYFLTYQYPDEPRCPQHDTLRLTPPMAARADFSVAPGYLTDEQRRYMLCDISSGTDSRTWFIDDVEQSSDSVVLFCTAPPSTYEPSEADTIRLRLVANNRFCADTAERILATRRCNVFFPNVFTPSADQNNRFGPLGSEMSHYHLDIFDRWGGILFQSDDPAATWDGTHKGRPCPQGAYMYVCRYDDIDGLPAIVRGTVTLVR